MSIDLFKKKPEQIVEVPAVQQPKIEGLPSEQYCKERLSFIEKTANTLNEQNKSLVEQINKLLLEREIVLNILKLYGVNDA